MITDFTALKKWNQIPENDRQRILSNVFCRDCKVTTIENYHMTDEPLGVLIEGQCATCKNPVARFVEGDGFQSESIEVDGNSYIEHEKRTVQIRQANKKILDDFEAWLYEKNLSKKTIEKHLDQVAFFIDEFLCYYSPALTPSEGMMKIPEFLGDWFIRKAMWSSPAYVKSNATSLKKFYGWMLETTPSIKKKDYQMVCFIMKEELPFWMEQAEF